MGRKFNNIRTFIYLSLFISGLFLTACTLNNDLDIEAPEQISAIVIEGYLAPQMPIQISVSRNNLMDDELILQSVWNAEAFITDRTDTIDLFNYFFINKSRKILVDYVSDLMPEDLSGDNLYLTLITLAGDTITSHTPKVSPVRISNAILEGNTITIANDFPEGGFTGFMRLDLSGYKDDSVHIASTQYIDLSESESANILVPVTEEMATMDSMLIKAFHITKAYYDYAISVYNAKSAYYDPFLTPEEVKSNVTNAIGIFTCYTFDEQIIYLH